MSGACVWNGSTLTVFVENVVDCTDVAGATLSSPVVNVLRIPASAVFCSPKEAERVMEGSIACLTSRVVRIADTVESSLVIIVSASPSTSVCVNVERASAAMNFLFASSCSIETRFALLFAFL